MNSTEEIFVYKNPQEFYASPTFSNRTMLGYSYGLPEKPTKKEKKWSIGSLFKRKKKDASESSSDEEQKKGFLGRRRRKSDSKGRKPKTVGGFDHIVLPKIQRTYNSYNHHEDTGILSDPSGGFANYMGRSVPLTCQNNAPHPQSTSGSFTNVNKSIGSIASVGSGDSAHKKKGKDLMKARAAARRSTFAVDSSSDDDSSLKSNSSLRMRSDESLVKPFHDVSHSRRSRAARTERYIKRHSKDGENPHNYLRLSKSDADDNRSASRSPLFLNTRHYPTSISSSQTSNMSGLNTIPPSHGVHGNFAVINSTSNPSYKPPLSMNEYNSSINRGNNMGSGRTLNTERSISCDANIHKDSSFEQNNVLRVQFPILRPHTRGYRNLSLISSSPVSSGRQPPQPPPRDPNRTFVPHYLENGRPSTVYLDNNFNQPKSKSFYVPSDGTKVVQQKIGSFSFNPSHRSTSEVHIPNDPFQISSPVRPASTTPEPKSNRYASRSTNERHAVDGVNYLADKNPRSRKPIVIQSTTKIEPRKDSPTQKALDFWKQIEESVTKSYPKTSIPSSSKPLSKIPQIFTSQTHVQSQVFLPSAVPNKINHLEPPRGSSPFKPVSPTVEEVHDAPIKVESDKFNDLSHIPKDDLRRKSSNLEEALYELEAIYNSLRLGDEYLLDRAEQRENETLVKRAEEKKKQTCFSHGGYRGALSDSSFNYEPFNQVDSPKRKNIAKKGNIPDTKEDDMYNRKLAKEKSATIGDPQSVLSNISYLLASPLHNADDSEGELKKLKINNEPDVTCDDVVYRNVKRSNASPKTVDPQPPFGIPLGPVAPAPNSDYLHATPEAIYTPPFIPKKIPDVVKDDLAFRNLRKDPNKEPVLPLTSGDEIKNNIYPLEKLDLNYLKKKRVVRSLSANIGNILGKDVKNSDDEEIEFKSKTLTDIADAMEIARRVLQEKEKNISDTRKAFMSDTDAKVFCNNGDTFKESRLKFLNGLKNQEARQEKNAVINRPPKGVTPERKISRPATKELTPIPKSALEENCSTNSSLDDLLNALAEEAKFTTERITRELKELEEKKSSEDSTNDKIVDGTTTTNKYNSSEKLKPCQKVLKAVVDSSTLVEYNKSPCEVVEEIAVHSPPIESANVIQSCFKDNSEDPKIESEENDYENIDSEEDKLDANTIEDQVEREVIKKCQSPFEERKAELVASFQELKNDIDEIKVPKFTSKKTDSIYDNFDDTIVSADGTEGEHRFDACRLNDSPSNPNNTQVFSSNVNTALKPSDSEHSSCDTAKLDCLESLKSPKLVLETWKRSTSAIPKSSNMVLELNRSTSSSTHSSNNDLPCTSTSGVDCRPHSSNERDDINHIAPKKSEKLSYPDPAKVTVTCLYGLACAHQLASIDLVSVLSLLFAVMSVIVALFL